MEYELIVNGLKIKANYHSEDIENVFKPMLKQWTCMQREKQKRIFVFLAAPAGCGKTTLSLFLQYLSEEYDEFENIQAIGMDGFHYTNDYLSSHYFEEDGKILTLKERKGNYATFDKETLKAKIIEGRYKDNSWPIYSREIHDPIKDQILLHRNIILVEGNYLLLNEKGWEDLIEYCDDCIFISCEEKILKERIVSRKIAGGYDRKTAEDFYDNSDKRNIIHILTHSHKANLMLEMKDDRFYIK